MSLLSRLFGRKPGPPVAPGAAHRPPEFLPSFAVDRERMFDLSLTQRLAELLQTPQSMRDDGWYPSFFGAAWNASIALPAPNAFTGPDGFPYLRIDIPAPGPFDSNSLANIARPCVEVGCGIALFPSPDAADPAYVMPLGLVESLLHYGDWRGDPQDLAEQGPNRAAGSVALSRGEEVLTGTPSADYLPPPIARALHRWLTERGTADPRVLLMSARSMRPSRSLVFNISRRAFASEDDAQDFSHRIIWHLPQSRSITLMPEGWDEASFTPLAQLFT